MRLTRVEERNGEWIYGGEVELGEVAHAPRDLRIDQPEGGTQLKGQLLCREIIASKILASPPCVDLMKRGTEEQILSSGENKVPRLILSNRQYDFLIVFVRSFSIHLFAKRSQEFLLRTFGHALERR